MLILTAGQLHTIEHFLASQGWALLRLTLCKEYKTGQKVTILLEQGKGRHVALQSRRTQRVKRERFFTAESMQEIEILFYSFKISPLLPDFLINGARDRFDVNKALWNSSKENRAMPLADNEAGTPLYRFL